MDQLSNFISEYLKTCETIKKLNSKLCRQRNLSASSFFTPIGLLSYRPYRFPIQFVWDFSLPGSLWASYFFTYAYGI